MQNTSHAPVSTILVELYSYSSSFSFDDLVHEDISCSSLWTGKLSIEVFNRAISICLYWRSWDLIWPPFCGHSGDCRFELSSSNRTPWYVVQTKSTTNRNPWDFISKTEASISWFGPLGRAGSGRVPLCRARTGVPRIKKRKKSTCQLRSGVILISANTWHQF